MQILNYLKILQASKLMQLQIEHTCSLMTQQHCLTCQQAFIPSLARVIVCNESGDAYGDLCAACFTQGSSFIRSRIHQRLEQGNSPNLKA